MASRRAITKAQAALPVGNEGGQVADFGPGVRSDRVQPGLRPPGPETGAEASGGHGADPRPPKYDAKVVTALHKDT